MTRNRLKRHSLLIFCVFVVIFTLSLAGSNDQVASFTIARGTVCVVPPDLSITLNTTHQSVQLYGNCPICTSSGKIAGHLKLTSTGAKTDVFTLKQLKEGLVVFQHYYSAGLEVVVFNLTLESPLDEQSLILSAQPFEGNISLTTEPRFLIKEGDKVLVDTKYLSASTNFQGQYPTLTYKVLSGSQYGVLEVFEGLRWVPVDRRLLGNNTFTQAEVNTSKVRYNQRIPLNREAVTDTIQLQIFSSQLSGPIQLLTVYILSNSSVIQPQLIFNVSTVLVTEGGSARVSDQSLSLSFSPSSIQVDSHSYSLSHKEIMVAVHIIQKPNQGFISVRNSSLSNGSLFMYTDLLNGNIIYYHSGSDTTHDTMVIRLSVISVSSQALLTPDPSSDIVLNFQISPVNDNLPKLHQHQLIAPLEGSYIILNESFFEITDSDNQPFDFLIQLNTSTGEGGGHFAHVRKDLDVKINQFRMSQLKGKEVVYVFRRLHVNEILIYHHNITISDGVHHVQERLQVSVIPMSISVSLNSPLNSSCLFEVDILDQSQTYLSKTLFDIEMTQLERLSEVTVDIVQLPLRGSLMVEGTRITSFSFSNINDAVYVVHDYLSQETEDSFKLQFSIGHGQSEVVLIRVCINPLPYPELINQTSFVVPSESEVIITDHILHTMQSRLDQPQSISYSIILEPKYGSIVNASTGMNVSTFTQKDINMERIVYKNDKRHPISTEFTDWFKFTVRNQHYSIERQYRINVTVKHSILNVTNRGFSVREGLNHTIRRNELSVEPLQGFTNIHIYIQQQTAEGNLTLARTQPNPLIDHPSYLDLDDLTNEYLIYEHDIKSEVPSDRFRFLIVALSDNNRQDHLTFYGEFKITVNLINDNRPREIKRTTIVVPEGGTKSITTDSLKFGDDDYGFHSDDLKYVVTYKSYSGQLCLRNECFDDLKVWYQRDLHGDLYYKDVRGSANGQYIAVFYVTDGYWRTQTVLLINIANIVAHRNASSNVIVDENSKINIGPHNIHYSTNSSGMVLPFEMKYSVTRSPQHGRLLSAKDTSIEITKFTQADINSGFIIYQQNGQNNLNDSFEFNLIIRTTYVTDSIVRITINPVDDDIPTLTIDRVLFVGNGSVVHINNSVLTIIDTDTSDPTKLRYYVQSTSAGKFEMRLSNDQFYTQTYSFTQHDVNKKLVRYKHDVLTAWSDSILLNVSDGTNMQNRTYILKIIIATSNTIPASVRKIYLKEGGNVTVTTSSITIGHPYFSVTGGKVSIIQTVVNGKLKLNGEDCKRDCLFDTGDIKHGRLVYIHNGTETTRDEFVFIIRWGSYSTHRISFPIEIEPVNDEPPLIVNNTRLDIYASSTVILTGRHLYTTDLDTPPEHIKYNFSISPYERREGYIVVNDTETNQFTQADINNELVSFVDRHTYDGFSVYLNFTVSDGVALVSSKFLYRPAVVALSMLIHNSVTIPMNHKVAITSSILSAFTNTQDIDSSTIMYFVGPLKYGHIESSSSSSLSSFSQSLINSGHVFYNHTADEIWESLDVAMVTVYHPLALQNLTTHLQVNIKLLDTLGSQLAVKKELSLLENAQVCINKSVLNAGNVRYFTWRKSRDTVALNDLYLSFEITSSPQYGNLLIRNGTSNPSSFTETDIEGGSICYKNDGTFESNTDTFSFKVIVKTLDGLVFNQTAPETLAINIELYNDEKPFLDSSLPLRKSFVQGFKGFITSSDISVRDSDNVPNGIYFLVTQPPVHGKLVLGTSTEPVDHFTQSDINNERLSFVSSELGSTSFEFSYSDGVFISNGSYVFTVVVEKLSLNVTRYDLKMIQFQTSVLITLSVLDSITNGNRSDTYLTVLEGPYHGEVLVSNRVSSHFTQHDIDHNLVQYRLTDTSQHRDWLILNVSNFHEFTTVNLSISVVIKGRVDNSVVLKVNYSQPLPPSILDLSDIKTPSALNIQLVSTLKYGYLSFKYPNFPLSTTAVTSFRYSMLESRMVYYTWDPPTNLQQQTNYTEEINGIVLIDDTSPGEFYLTLTLVPPIVPSSVISTTMQLSSASNTPSTIPGTGGTGNELQASFYVPLVGLLFVILLLFVIVTVFCCYQSKTIKNNLTKGFVPPSSSLSQKPPYYYSPPVVTGHEDSDTESSISGADIMMVQNVHNQSHPMMTISASHTHIPYSHDPGYHTHTMGGTTSIGTYMDEVSYSHSPTQFRHLESPHSAATYFPSHIDQFGHDIRSTSPNRRPSPTRRNSRPYASLTRVNVGRSSPVKSLRDYPITTPLHFPRPDSSSSIGYDSSCLTEERHSRPPSAMTPVRMEGTVSQQGEGSIIYTTVRPTLKMPQYWV